jgi:glycosyltransferase involved in cell wall biosynthesis
LNTNHRKLEVKVVGRKPSNSLREILAENKEIALHSDVPEIMPYLSAARVMMVPLRIGGGSRLKILEAMAAGLPVVSTTKGAEGLSVTNNDNIIIRDDPKQFAEALISLHQNDEFHHAIAEKGLAFINQRYSWNRVAQNLAGLWNKVADV